METPTCSKQLQLLLLQNNPLDSASFATASPTIAKVMALYTLQN